jgi:hypothetical protein
MMTGVKLKSVAPVKTGECRFTILSCPCGFTAVNVAISIMSIRYEIASVVTLPRKDITIQSHTPVHNPFTK